MPTNEELLAEVHRHSQLGPLLKTASMPEVLLRVQGWLEEYQQKFVGCDLQLHEAKKQLASIGALLEGWRDELAERPASASADVELDPATLAVVTEELAANLPGSDG